MADAYSFVKTSKLKLKGHKDKKYEFPYQTIRKSPDTPDKSGEICFGLVKYFNFFLINMF